MKIGYGDFFIEITGEDFGSFFGSVREGLTRLSVSRNKKNKVGIVLAIRTENHKEKIRLQNDLIKNLQQYLHGSRAPQIFNIITLSERHSKKINDYKSALQYLKRTRGHLMVFGDISERKIEGENQFVFKLEGAVIHRPIPKILSDKFAREFSELMPMRWNFPESDELLGFEITHQWLGFTAKYIIGIAALISADFMLAFDIFSQLKEEINDRCESTSVPAVAEIKKRLPMRLVETSMAICKSLYFAYTKTRDVEYIKKQKPFLDVLREYYPQSYEASLSRAIYLFLIEGNVAGAKDEIRRIKSDNRFDATWRYSLAFLLAYEGNLRESKDQYDKALEKYVGPNVVNDTEVFITDMLEREPNKIQFYFFRGYINFKAKNDLILAKEDFEKFIERATPAEYSEELRLAKIYVNQC